MRRAGAGWRPDTGASAVTLPEDDDDDDDDTRSVRSVDIRNLHPGPTFQLTPMVLCLDTLEESTLEVSAYDLTAHANSSVSGAALRVAPHRARSSLPQCQVFAKAVSVPNPSGLEPPTSQDSAFC